MYRIIFRQDTGSMQNLSIAQQSTVEFLKQSINEQVKAEPNSIDLSWRGKLLDEQLNKLTL
jgi:hypothetical protein